MNADSPLILPYFAIFSQTKKLELSINQSTKFTATWTRQYVRFLVKRLAFNSTLINAHSLSDKNALLNIYSQTNQGPN